MDTMSFFKPVPVNNDFLCVNLFTQMEYCDYDTLEDFIKMRSKPDRKQNYDIMSQLVNGVASFHAMGIVHRDLQPSNIFF
jgi:serine/threonine protein kinase